MGGHLLDSGEISRRPPPFLLKNSPCEGRSYIIFIRFEATPKGVASLLSKIRGVVKMSGYDLRQDFGMIFRKNAKL